MVFPKLSTATSRKYLLAGFEGEWLERERRETGGINVFN
jgi:hypothetical protein